MTPYSFFPPLSSSCVLRCSSAVRAESNNNRPTSAWIFYGHKGHLFQRLKSVKNAAAGLIRDTHHTPVFTSLSAHGCPFGVVSTSNSRTGFLRVPCTWLICIAVSSSSSSSSSSSDLFVTCKITKLQQNNTQRGYTVTSVRKAISLLIKAGCP